MILEGTTIFDGRGENKDAHDLNYVVRNFGSGVDDVFARLKPLLGDPDAQRALAILRRDFLDLDMVGPRGWLHSCLAAATRQSRQTSLGIATAGDDEAGGAGQGG